MADNTKIEWADATLNYANGCSVVSPGCTNCYAMRLAGTRMKHHPTREGLTVDSKAGPVWNGIVRLHEPALWQAIKWKRGRKIFWNAHGDIFHDAVPDEAIDKMFAACALSPQHIHMILTKRSARMRKYMTDPKVAARIAALILRWAGESRTTFAQAFAALLDREQENQPESVCWPLPNVWMGVSTEDQPRADERIPDLLGTPATILFISAEPLLGPIDLSYCRSPYEIHTGWPGTYAPLVGSWWPAIGDPDEEYRNRQEGLAKIDLVIVGGESGPHARPMHPNDPRMLRDQCASAGVAFDFKQWGEWGCPTAAPVHIADGPMKIEKVWFDRKAVPHHQFSDGTTVLRIGKRAAGRLLDGIEHNGFQEANP